MILIIRGGVLLDIFKRPKTKPKKVHRLDVHRIVTVKRRDMREYIINGEKIPDVVRKPEVRSENTNGD